jgi:5-methylcytosine-specific restriction endonuclease McrA
MKPQSRGYASVCRARRGIDAGLNASDENNMSNWRAKYNAYMRSEEWQRMRSYILETRGARCEWCGAPGTQIHHRTYERLGHELPIDLQVLCRQCHAEADIERAKIGRKKSADALYAAGLDSYASKKYGDDWDQYCDREGLEREFDQWLEDRDDD